MKRAVVTGAGRLHRLAPRRAPRARRLRCARSSTTTRRARAAGSTARRRASIEFRRTATCATTTCGRAAGADVVFHLAALVGIPYSYETPQAYVRTNVDGALNVLEAAREHGAERVVLTSTSEVYGSAQYAPMDEAHPRAPSRRTPRARPVGRSARAELPRVVQRAGRSRRPFNAYGPRQSDRALIPTVTAQPFCAGDRLRLGNFTRRATSPSWTTSCAASRHRRGRRVGEAVHIGSGVERLVGEIVQLIARLMGKDAQTRRRTSAGVPSAARWIACVRQLAPAPRPAGCPRSTSRAGCADHRLTGWTSAARTSARTSTAREGRDPSRAARGAACCRNDDVPEADDAARQTVRMLEILIRQLHANGIREIVVATGYLDEIIRAYFADGSALDVSITYSKESRPLGTAGPL